LLTVAVLGALLWTTYQFGRPREVEAHVFGLGGDASPAARAAATRPETWQADRLYFSGSDQRSFGVAYLPGLAYREMHWIDATQALVWPAAGKRGLLIRPAGTIAPLLDLCWDDATRASRLAEPAVGTDRIIQWLPDPAQRACATSDGRLASFGGLIDLLSARLAPPLSPGKPEVIVAWRVTQRPSVNTLLVVEQLAPDGSVRGSTTTAPYPSSSWEPGELVVVRAIAPPAADPSAPPRLAVGFTRGNNQNRMTIDDPLRLYNQIRVLLDE
jgi:hypothetical protein